VCGSWPGRSPRGKGPSPLREDLAKYLGAREPSETEEIDESSRDGLAWTRRGDILFVEVPSSTEGNVMITGYLGDVMKRRPCGDHLRPLARGEARLPRNFHASTTSTSMSRRGDPEGRLRRDHDCDGAVSSLTGIPVRRDVAMTGEITLRGRVLPIGGLKEKRWRRFAPDQPRDRPGPEREDLERSPP